MVSDGNLVLTWEAGEKDVGMAAGVPSKWELPSSCVYRSRQAIETTRVARVAINTRPLGETRRARKLFGSVGDKVLCHCQPGTRDKRPEFQFGRVLSDK
jgi:hypothetical protein